MRWEPLLWVQKIMKRGVRKLHKWPFLFVRTHSEAQAGGPVAHFGPGGQRVLWNVGATDPQLTATDEELAPKFLVFGRERLPMGHTLVLNDVEGGIQHKRLAAEIERGCCPFAGRVRPNTGKRQGRTQNRTIVGQAALGVLASL
jgi:hypothetical protein